MSILSKATTGAMIAGAALLVAACGGGAANNTANAPAPDNTVVDNGPTTAPDNGMTGGMTDNNAMAAPAPAGNAAAPAGNASNGM